MEKSSVSTGLELHVRPKRPKEHKQRALSYSCRAYILKCIYNALLHGLYKCLKISVNRSESIPSMSTIFLIHLIIKLEVNKKRFFFNSQIKLGYMMLGKLTQEQINAILFHL